MSTQVLSIATENGELIKRIFDQNIEDSNTFGFYSIFGFVSEKVFSDRAKRRAHRGLKVRNDAWAFRFKLSQSLNDWTLDCIEGCKAEKLNENSWKLITAQGIYHLFESPALHATRI